MIAAVSLYRNSFLERPFFVSVILSQKYYTKKTHTLSRTGLPTIRVMVGVLFIYFRPATLISLNINTSFVFLSACIVHRALLRLRETTLIYIVLLNVVNWNTTVCAEEIWSCGKWNGLIAVSLHLFKRETFFPALDTYWLRICLISHATEIIFALEQLYTGFLVVAKTCYLHSLVCVGQESYHHVDKENYPHNKKGPKQ